MNDDTHARDASVKWHIESTCMKGRSLILNGADQG